MASFADFALAPVRDEVVLLELMPRLVLGGWTLVEGNRYTTTVASRVDAGAVPGGVYRRVVGVWENGQPLTPSTSINTVNTTPGTWLWRDFFDLLHVHSTTGADPDTFTSYQAVVQFHVATKPIVLNMTELGSRYPVTVLLGSPGIVSYWRLGEGAGSTAVDSGSTQNGTYVGGVTQGVPGVLNDGNFQVDLDGSTGHVSVAHNAAHLLAGGGAIEAWITPASAGGGRFGRIVDKSTGGSGANGYAFYLWDSGASGIRIRGNIAGNAAVVASDANSITLGVKQHVIMSWNAFGQVTFFINGQVNGNIDQQSGDCWSNSFRRRASFTSSAMSATAACR